eukprot:9334774-Pyramimonas_sp.AAC.1
MPEVERQLYNQQQRSVTTSLARWGHAGAECVGWLRRESACRVQGHSVDPCTSWTRPQTH